MSTKDQLVLRSSVEPTVMEVTSDQNVWIIPPQFGLWLPAHRAHQIRMPERVSMRTIYLRRGVALTARSCAVLHIGPLLRELR